jgi:hypothetical protein
MVTGARTVLLTYPPLLPALTAPHHSVLQLIDYKIQKKGSEWVGIAGDNLKEGSM